MKRLISICLTIVFLMSTVGVTIGKHYCSGKLKSSKLYTVMDSKSCCGDEEMPSDCCKDELQYKKVEDDYVPTVLEIRLLKLFTITFVYHNFSLDFSFDIELPEYLHYKPPLLQLDVPVMIQSFLI